MAQLGKGPDRRILVAVTVAVVIAVTAGVLLFLDRGDDDSSETKAPELGACAVLSGTREGARHEEVDCDDASAAYEVVSADGTCDENAEITIDGSCLALSAEAGDCFDLGSIDEPAAKVDCSDADTGSTIVKVVSVGKADDQCATGAQPLRNTARDTLLCLGPAA